MSTLYFCAVRPCQLLKPQGMIVGGAKFIDLYLASAASDGRVTV